jgi:uncharacterized caspase-like protein
VKIIKDKSFKLLIDKMAMKRILYTILFSFLISASYSQGIAYGVSKSGNVNIVKEIQKPPYLEIVPGSVSLMDENENKIIDAGEKAMIYFQLRNTGSGPGLNLSVVMSDENEIQGVYYNSKTNIGQLNPGEERQIKVPVAAGRNLHSGRVLFKIYVAEVNGFDSDPVEIEIETKAFEPPRVKVVDYKVTSENSSTLQRRRPFDIQALIQNVGKGTAKNVKINLSIPENVYCLTGNENQMVARLDPGDEFLANYTFVTNNHYSSSTIPIKINLSEAYGKYAESKTIILTMNQKVSSDKMIVAGINKPEVNIKIASLTSDVDKNIPEVRYKNPNRMALIIGNEDYSNTVNSEINVSFAKNDAEVFRKYAVNVLGVKEENVHLLLDATAGQMRREIDLVTAILKKLGNKGELIFYYAGHGFPDEVTKTPLLIPVDVDATNLESAIKLVDVYKKFGETNASRITVFLDACFSGGGRNQGLLAARAVSVKPKKETLAGNMVVFSASSGQQVSMAYKEKQHGMFTYFLLYKLQQTKGNVSYGEMADYLRQEVGLTSLKVNGKPQDPEVNVSNNVYNKWRFWRFNR